MNGGIFDLIDEKGEDRGKEAARLAAELEATIASNYGLARDHYLDRLTNERSGVQGARLSDC